LTEPKKVIVVDLDDTLFRGNILSCFLLWLSKLVYKIGILIQSVDVNVSSRLRQYSKRIVLSGRANDWARNLTLMQLAINNIGVDEVILCPRAKLYDDWKRKKITELQQQHGSLDWIDHDIESCA